MRVLLGFILFYVSLTAPKAFGQWDFHLGEQLALHTKLADVVARIDSAQQLSNGPDSPAVEACNAFLDPEREHCFAAIAVINSDLALALTDILVAQTQAQTMFAHYTVCVNNSNAVRLGQIVAPANARLAANISLGSARIAVIANYMRTLLFKINYNVGRAKLESETVPALLPIYELAIQNLLYENGKAIFWLKVYVSAINRELASMAAFAATQLLIVVPANNGGGGGFANMSGDKILFGPSGLLLNPPQILVDFAGKLNSRTFSYSNVFDGYWYDTRKIRFRHSAPDQMTMPENVYDEFGQLWIPQGAPIGIALTPSFSNLDTNEPAPYAAPNFNVYPPTPDQPLTYGIRATNLSLRYKFADEETFTWMHCVREDHQFDFLYPGEWISCDVPLRVDGPPDRVGQVVRRELIVAQIDTQHELEQSAGLTTKQRLTVQYKITNPPNSCYVWDPLFQSWRFQYFEGCDQ